MAVMKQRWPSGASRGLKNKNGVLLTAAGLTKLCVTAGAAHPPRSVALIFSEHHFKSAEVL